MNEALFIGKKVRKISGKPFKHGGKISTIKGIVTNPHTGRNSYTFVEDDSYVECKSCLIVNGI